MSLTTCLKMAGKALGDRDKAAILAYSRQHRAAGLDTDTAAKRAVDDHLKDIEGQLARAEAAFKAAPKESTQLSVGTAPGHTEPVTVRDGVVHIGKYEAVDFDSGEPIRVKEGATDAEVKKALVDGGALSSKQKFFGGSGEEPPKVRQEPKEKAPQTQAHARSEGAADDPFPPVEQFDRINVGPGGFIKPHAVAPGKPTFRETDVAGLDDRMREDRYAVPFGGFVADRQEIALGQGTNRGVHIAFRPDAVSGREHAKPMTGDLAGREYRADLLAPRAVQAITMFPTDLKRTRLLTRQRVAADFDRHDLPDGRVHFTRKGLPELSAPEPEPIGFKRNPSGTVSVTGDSETIRRVLESAGVSRIISAKDSLLVGKSDASVAQEALAKFSRARESAPDTANARSEVTPRRSDEKMPSGLTMDEARAKVSQMRGASVDAVRKAVDEMTAGWKNGPKIDVVQTAADLPGENPADVRGLYTPGHIWIVAGVRDHRTRLGIARTLAHEAVAHYGLRNMLGREGWTQLMKQIHLAVESGNKPLGEIQAYVRKTYRNADGTFTLRQDAEADEIAARAMELAIDTDGNFKPGFGFFKAVWSKVAQFLREHGINVKFSNAELQGMLVRSMRNLEVGERTAGGARVAVAAARDEVAHARGETASADDAAGDEPKAQPKERTTYKGPGAELITSTKDVVGRLVNDAMMKVAPMSAGADVARAVAKDYANAERLARHKWAKFDDVLVKNFTADQRRQMWEAADEQNVLLQEGKDTKGKGLDRLNPEQRKVMDTLHAYGESLLQRAKEVGMFQGEGLPYWTPRMAVMIGTDGEYHRPGEGQTAADEGRGFNLTKTSGNLKQRKYLTAEETEAAMKKALGDGAQLVRDIRTMPLAMARLERAIAGRDLINQIRDIGRTTGIDTTASREGPNFFTVNHPAFKTMVPRQVPVRLSEYFDRKLMDGLTQLADNLGIQHQRKGALKGRALGLAYRDKPLVETKFFTPEQVLTHEIGHQIDYKYGLADQLTKRGATAKELRALADLRIEGQEHEASDHYRAYLRKGTEKIANLVHAYVHNPERFREVAPETFKWFDAFVERTPQLAPLKDLGPSLTLGSRSVEGKVTQWEQRPLYVSKDFEGPLKAILAEQSGEMYKQMMNLKGKTMGLIMYSPLIHNAVEWGRALPIMPGKVLTFRVYFDGNKIKNDPLKMAQAIKDGMVPIGHRGALQDITGIMEEPNLAPGRSWTAKLLGGAVGLANKAAGTAVRKGVDAAGDFWHNTLLWDRVGDLQAGLYGNMRDDLVRKGMDEQTAGRLAAHFANRYAGALPNEAMSANARKVANFVLFSRSFTLGNLGVMKDIVTGFPPDVAAQIQRDAGEMALRTGKSVARRTAAAAFALDMALMYAGNALLQSALDKLKRDKSWDEITQGYVDRFHDLVHRTQESPLDVLSSPLQSLVSLTPNSRNEPGKEDRIHYGTDEAGTQIYLRSPVGKVGEEFKNWITSPLDTLLRKQGTVMRPITQTLSGPGGDKGFGQRVYDPDDKSWQGLAKNVGRVVWNFMSQQLPVDSGQALADWAQGNADDTDKLKVLGPLMGVTFSKGAPGGPEVGEMYHESKVHEGQVADVMPDVRRAIKTGDVDKAIDLMEGVNMTKSQIKAVLKHQLEPSTRLSESALKRYYGTASEESRQRMENYGR